MKMERTINYTSSSSENDSDGSEKSNCELFKFVVCSILMGLTCTLGTTGNVASFVVFSRQKVVTSSIFLLKCLTVFDSLFLVLGLFIYPLPGIASYTGSWRIFEILFDTVAKLYVWPLATTMHTCIVWLTVLVTVNRYNAISRAVEEFTSASAKLHSTYVRLVVVVVFSVVYNLPRFLEHTVGLETGNGGRPGGTIPTNSASVTKI